MMKAAEEPVRDINVRNSALGDGTEEDQCVGNPDQRDQDVNRPFQFRVLLALGNPERQSDRRQHE